MNIELCKLCYREPQSENEHCLELCSDAETLRWMNHHNTRLPCYEKQHLWYSLDEKHRRLLNFHIEMQGKLSVEYYAFPYGSHECLAQLIRLMFRMIAVFRWAQVAFCVQDERLNAWASNDYEVAN